MFIRFPYTSPIYINSGISIKNNPDDMRNNDNDFGLNPSFTTTDIVVNEHKKTNAAISGVKPLIPVSKFVPISVVNRLNIQGDIVTTNPISIFIFQRCEIGDFQKCINVLGIITMRSGAHIISPCPIPVFTCVVNIPDAEVWKVYK